MALNMIALNDRRSNDLRCYEQRCLVCADGTRLCIAAFLV